MSDLIERLRKVEHGRSDKFGMATHWYRNPDGPEAAAEIGRLRKLVNTAAEVTEDYERKLSKCERELAAREAELSHAALTSQMLERELAEAKAAFNTLDELKSRVDTRLERVERELAEARGALQELRIRLHAAGRRPEECYEMGLIDAALAADEAGVRVCTTN